LFLLIKSNPGTLLVATTMQTVVHIIIRHSVHLCRPLTLHFVSSLICLASSCFDTLRRQRRAHNTECRHGTFRLATLQNRAHFLKSSFFAYSTDFLGDQHACVADLFHCVCVCMSYLLQHLIFIFLSYPIHKCDICQLTMP
jgi:hypothetical protein